MDSALNYDFLFSIALYLRASAINPMRSFHHRLAERRVSVHIVGNFCRGQFHALRQGQLGQQFRHIRADHVRTQDLAVLCVGDDLDPANIIPQTQRFAVGLEGETSNLDFIAFFFGLGFGVARRTPPAGGCKWHAASWCNPG